MSRAQKYEIDLGFLCLKEDVLQIHLSIKLIQALVAIARHLIHKLVLISGKPTLSLGHFEIK